MKLALRALFVTVLFQCALAQEVRFFPQVGDGVHGDLGLRTSVVLANTGRDAEATIEFFQDDGQPLEMEFPAPFGKGSSFSIPLGSGHTVMLETPGTGPLQAGYARLTAPAGVDGTAVFTGFDVPSGTILFEAGVPAAGTLTSFTAVLDSLGDRNTGLAVLCPPGATGGEKEFTLTLYDEKFARIASRDITIAAGQKLAKYIEEFFTGDAAAIQAAREMRGSVCVSSSTPLAAVTLRQMAGQPFPIQVPTLTTFPVMNATAYPKEGEWRLVWSDEFDGTQIDPAKWERQIGAGGWGNNELQFYTSLAKNARVEEGKLIIEAYKEPEPYAGSMYTSARMRTIRKGDWTYGRFEIRARMPRGKGIWPAVWMMPTDDFYGTWAASGEIDIVECLGHETNKVYGTLHYGGEWPNNRSSGGSRVLPTGNFADDFHVFKLEWEPGVMRWYVDDHLFLTQPPPEWHANLARTPAPFPAPFDKRFHLILNVAVGGNWPGSPDGSTQFPQRMEVDYIRVYQRR